MKLLITLVLSVFALNAIAASDLKLTTQNDTAYMIPASTQSCLSVAMGVQAGDIGSKFILFQNPSLAWNNPSQQFVLSYIQIRFHDVAVQPQSCTIAGSELGMVFGSGVPMSSVSPATPWTDMTIMPMGQKQAWAYCPQIKCGGFHVAGNVARRFDGEISAVGFAIDAKGHSVPVTATKSISAVNTADGN